MILKYTKVYSDGHEVPCTIRNAEQRHLAYVQGKLLNREDSRGIWTAKDITCKKQVGDLF